MADTPTDAAKLEKIADTVRGLFRATVKNIIEIGEHLAEAKDLAGHGNWLPWLEREFKWSDRTAQRFINAYERFGSNPTLVSDLDPSSVYLVAAPSTPEATREEVIRQAKSGPVSRRQVKEVIKSHKPKPPPKSKPQAEPLQNVASDGAKQSAAQDTQPASAFDSDPSQVDGKSHHEPEPVATADGGLSHDITSGEAEQPRPEPIDVPAPEVEQPESNNIEPTPVRAPAALILRRFEGAVYGVELDVEFFDEVDSTTVIAAMSEDQRRDYASRLRGVSEIIEKWVQNLTCDNVESIVIEDGGPSPSTPLDGAPVTATLTAPAAPARGAADDGLDVPEFLRRAPKVTAPPSSAE